MRFSTIVAVISFTFLTSTQAAPTSHITSGNGNAPAPPWRRDLPTTDSRRSAESTHSDAPPWRRDTPTINWRRAAKSTETNAPPWKREIPTESRRRGTDSESGSPTNDWKREAELLVDRALGLPTEDWRRSEDVAEGYPSQGWK